jgi:hypothetical protein
MKVRGQKSRDESPTNKGLWTEVDDAPSLSKATVLQNARLHGSGGISKIFVFFYSTASMASSTHEKEREKKSNKLLYAQERKRKRKQKRKL